jgi:hexosaminidase
LWKANYSKAYFDLKATILPSPENNGVLWKLDSKVKDGNIIYIDEIAHTRSYSTPLLITKSHSVTAWLHSSDNKKMTSITQKFSFNKATGKKITLTNEASKNYPGSGAFTLVNGVQNEKGLASSREFLGFLGTDCEAVIDLGSFQGISSVTVHALQGIGSWIWAPASVEAYGSVDNQYFSRLGTTTVFKETTNGKGTMTILFDNAPTQFVKIVVKNKGIIPEGNPGASNKAWLFVDEIEIDTPSP